MPRPTVPTAKAKADLLRRQHKKSTTSHIEQEQQREAKRKEQTQETQSR